MLPNCSRITLGSIWCAPWLLPDYSRHALPCSRYDPGCSGSQKQREVGPKMEREGLEASAENNYSSMVVNETKVYGRRRGKPGI